jgi:hypothetical protein
MNKWYIGQKVYDESYGHGVINYIVLDDVYPIKVEFVGCYETYTMDGKEYKSWNQSLFFVKQGTPEARRIVAMLAMEYRKSKLHMGDSWDKGYCFAKIEVYKKAKAMLG